MNARRTWCSKALVAVVVAGGAIGLQPLPADAVVLAVGACLLTIELTGAVEPLPPAEAAFTLSGGGTCVVDDPDNLAPATVSGMLGGVEGEATVGCLAAVLQGTVTLDVTTGGYGSMTGMMSAAVSIAGVAPLVTVTVPTFVAAGVFVQDPFDTVACISHNEASSLTWLGLLAFEDPVL